MCRTTTPSFDRGLQRDYKQTAVFASVDFDLIPKVLTLTAGTRHFRFDELDGRQRAVAASGCFEAVRRTGAAHGRRQLTTSTRRISPTDESGFKSRGNLTWHVTPDAMVYYTFSQGFRPGGFNQNGGCHACLDQTASNPVRRCPSSYPSDKLTNNEIGWKTEFFDHRLQWNGAVYHENWDNAQVAFFDPGVTRQHLLRHQRPNYRIKGVETAARRRAYDGLTAAGLGLLEQSEQTNSPA